MLHWVTLMLIVFFVIGIFVFGEWRSRRIIRAAHERSLGILPADEIYHDLLKKRSNINAMLAKTPLNEDLTRRCLLRRQAVLDEQIENYPHTNVARTHERRRP